MERDVGLLLLGALYQTIFPYQRKVKRYLESANPDSILDDFSKVLQPALREHEIRLSQLFRDFCIKDADIEVEYWNQECFGNYIRTKHDSNFLSNQTISLLWRSFSYYSCHPFPRGEVDQSRIDESAFHRGVALLALQANDFLGTQEGDWFWRHEDEYFHRKTWERMLRSISLPSDAKLDADFKDGREAVVSDIMDVISMTQPQPPLPNTPSPVQLEPAANALFDDKSRGTKCVYRATKTNVQSLIEVLIRLRLRKGKWGRFFHLGDLHAFSEQGAKLSKMIVFESHSAEKREGSEDDEDDDVLTADDITRMIDRLPNLHLRFLQLWSMIFQPQEHMSGLSSDDKLTCDVPNYEVTLGALSLFIPQTSALARYGERLSMDDTRIAFTETSPLSRTESTFLSITRLAKALCEKATRSRITSHYLVLFTSSSQQPTDSDPVLGIYLPGPLFTTDEHEGEAVYCVSRASSSDCLMLQLWSELQVAKWKGDGVDLVKMLSGDSSAAHITELALARVAMGSPKNNENVLAEIPYWMGGQHSNSNAAENLQTGLYIDPNKRTVTLTSKPLSPGKSGFEPLRSDRETCMIEILNAEMHIFTVSGEAIVGEWTKPSILQDLSRYTRDEKAVLVAGEELKSRIEGFGSS
ncbi:hypothetical protein BKA65DRAFT_514871 [Rhexocercosporidium sp. MPI-PUGE-AT-0058]|nr:hypothetical protein BKA65DRAFT_514871 [Rhexocercosporidium sp. MPI-PUGE-AT-0058]